MDHRTLQPSLRSPKDSARGLGTGPDDFEPGPTAHYLAALSEDSRIKPYLLERLW